LILFLIWAFVSLSVAPYNLQYSSFQLSLESLEHLLSSSASEHVWVPYTRAGNTQDFRASFFVSSIFGICRPV
jgi:hypothetical protein